MTLSDTDRHTLARWRLVLGKEAEGEGITLHGDFLCQGVQELVDFVFGPGGEGSHSDRGHGGDRSQQPRGAGPGHATLQLPEWVNHVEELFPNKAKEVLQRELIKNRGIRELLDSPTLLEKIEPNTDLVKLLLTNKDLLSPKTRILARKVIDKVIEELKKKMRTQVESTMTGALRRDRHSPRRVFRNLDLKRTINRNLKNFDHERGKMLVENLYFFAAERKQKPWHIVIVVDQSGSMMESTIFSTVMASIFFELPSLKTSLILYDTRLVDLSSQVGSPVDVLMSTQLGGGNDTPLALRYANQLIRQPARTILVLISDFYEGALEDDMVRIVGEMSRSGIHTIGLAALSYDARPEYCKRTALRLRKAGMDIMVTTPEQLADCMARIISRRR